MFVDLIPFDECRYVYEWLPAREQIASSLENKSWQYIFRFAVDGLVKGRINYNNEFFYQGSVVSKNVELFGDKRLKERIKI